MVTWNISTIERTLPEGVVTILHWQVSKQDGQYSANNYGTITLPTKDPQDPTFIPYASITKEQAITWLKDAMGAEQVAAYEAALDKQIQDQINPKQATGVPWVS